MTNELIILKNMKAVKNKSAIKKWTILVVF